MLKIKKKSTASKKKRLAIYFRYQRLITGLKTAAKELVTETENGEGETRNILSGLPRELGKQNVLMQTKKALKMYTRSGKCSKQQQ